MSYDLSFSAHISKIVSKSSSKIGLMYRAFSSRDLVFMINFFRTHVRPILEYNCEVWSPFFLQDIDRLENVQRRFTKRIKGLYNSTYSERLHMCMLEPLELRRLKKDLILTHRIFYKTIHLNFDDFFTFSHLSQTRGHSLKLYPKVSKTTRAHFFFSNRVVNIWNSLPQKVVSTMNLNSFKKLLN